MSSIGKGNRPKGLSFGNEYGLYDEVDERVVFPEVVNTYAYNVPALIKTNLSLQTPSTSAKRTNPACHIICGVEDTPSPTACRSYPALKSSAKVACISINGLRIVQDAQGEDAEYHIKLAVDSKVASSWKRYSNFKALGDALEEFCDGGLLIRRSKHLQESLATWRKIQEHRPWLLRDLSVQFLREETQLLEVFLSSLLFEVPTVDLLLEFVTHDTT
jgi:hypothetical protein